MQFLKIIIWVLVIVTVVGCYLLKLVGYLVPARVLDHGPTRRAVELLPVALLAALVVVEAVADGSHYVIDWPRLAGFGVGGTRAGGDRGTRGAFTRRL